MLDLHSDDAVVNHYADRYRNLMPANIRKTIQQMDTAEATACEIWDKTLPLVTTEGVSLEVAMWAVWHTNNFRDAILLAANLADDADSVGATAGQLAGALYGYSGIPQKWKDKLVQHERLVSMAGELFHSAPEDNFF